MGQEGFGKQARGPDSPKEAEHWHDGVLVQPVGRVFLAPVDMTSPVSVGTTDR